MSKECQSEQVPPTDTPQQEETANSYESVDNKVPNSISTKDAHGLSTAVGMDVTEARQLLLLLASDDSAGDQQKQTLVSALRALDNALQTIGMVDSTESESYALGIPSVTDQPHSELQLLPSETQVKKPSIDNSDVCSVTSVNVDLTDSGSTAMGLPSEIGQPNSELQLLPSETQVKRSSVNNSDVCSVTEGSEAQLTVILSQDGLIAKESSVLELPPFNEQLVSLGSHISEPDIEMFKQVSDLPHAEVPVTTLGKIRKSRRSRRSSRNKGLRVKRSSQNSDNQCSVAWSTTEAAENQMTFVSSQVGLPSETDQSHSELQLLPSETQVERSSVTSVNVDKNDSGSTETGLKSETGQPHSELRPMSSETQVESSSLDNSDVCSVTSVNVDKTDSRSAETGLQSETDQPHSEFQSLPSEIQVEESSVNNNEVCSVTSVHVNTSQGSETPVAFILSQDGLTTNETSVLELPPFNNQGGSLGSLGNRFNEQLVSLGSHISEPDIEMFNQDLDLSHAEIPVTTLGKIRKSRRSRRSSRNKGLRMKRSSQIADDQRSTTLVNASTDEASETQMAFVSSQVGLPHNVSSAMGLPSETDQPHSELQLLQSDTQVERSSVDNSDVLSATSVTVELTDSGNAAMGLPSEIGQPQVAQTDIVSAATGLPSETDQPHSEMQHLPSETQMERSSVNDSEVCSVTSVHANASEESETQTTFTLSQDGLTANETSVLELPPFNNQGGSLGSLGNTFDEQLVSLGSHISEPDIELFNQDSDLPHAEVPVTTLEKIWKSRRSSRNKGFIVKRSSQIADGQSSVTSVNASTTEASETQMTFASSQTDLTEGESSAIGLPSEIDQPYLELQLLPSETQVERSSVNVDRTDSVSAATGLPSETDQPHSELQLLPSKTQVDRSSVSNSDVCSVASVNIDLTDGGGSAVGFPSETDRPHSELQLLPSETQVERSSVDNSDVFAVASVNVDQTASVSAAMGLPSETGQPRSELQSLSSETQVERSSADNSEVCRVTSVNINMTDSGSAAMGLRSEIDQPHSELPLLPSETQEEISSVNKSDVYSVTSVNDNDLTVDKSASIWLPSQETQVKRSSGLLRKRKATPPQSVAKRQRSSISIEQTVERTTIPTEPEPCSSDDSSPMPCVSDNNKEQPMVEPLPVTTTVKQEFPEDAIAAAAELNVHAADTMGYVCYYVRAAFQALLGANLEAQVAAVSALPPNLGQPAEERASQVQSGRARRRRVRRVWNGEAFVPEAPRREETGPYTRSRRRRK